MKLPNFAYHASLRRGRLVRMFYKKFLGAIAGKNLPSGEALPFAVYGYCGREGMPEQVASIRSFLRNVGVPLRYVVVSDGSLGKRERRILELISPCVAVIELGEMVRLDFQDYMHPYVDDHFLGRKLAIIMSLPLDVPCLYADSDVLFFPGARKYVLEESEAVLPASYLPDCQFVGDERLIRNEFEKKNSANAGFIFIRSPLDWSLACERFSEIKGTPMFFTEQTMVHLALHANKAKAMDPSRFVLQLDDQFGFFDEKVHTGLAMRHYVAPIRHKFWNAVF